MNLAEIFADPPRSINTFGRRTSFTYVRTGTSSLDWAGSDWTSPTALDFKTDTMDANIFAVQVSYPHERQPVHPIHLINDLADVWARLRDGITSGGHVMDADERIGVEISDDFRSTMGMLRVRVKCWPAVAGVTTSKRDVTL